MSMLTAQELADLRSDVLETLPDTCYIERDSQIAGTSDAYGFVTPSWGTAGTVSCRCDPFFRTAGGQVADREALRDYYRFTFAYDTDIQASDRINFSSDLYEIVELHDDHSLRAVRWALCSKIQGA